jgi:hypothetical protein
VGFFITINMKFFNIKKWFKNKTKKKVIGRIERVNIPKLDLYGVNAKIDTGAYRGSIHAENIKVVRMKKSGKRKLKFNVLDAEHPENDSRVYRVSKFKKVQVRTSQTEFETRYAIFLKIEIAGEELKTYLSLSDRKDMRYPILIGRKALKRKFLVDVGVPKKEELIFDQEVVKM